MSLREEISEIINFINGFKDGKFYSKEEGIEDIVKIFEKRVDSKIQETLNLKRGNWYDAKAEGMKEIKEILK